MFPLLHPTAIRQPCSWILVQLRASSDTFTPGLSSGREGSVNYLDGENWRLLLVENVPGVQHSVLSGREEDGGSGGTPAAVSEVLRVGAGPHDGALLDVLGPDPGAPVAHRQEILYQSYR